MDKIAYWMYTSNIEAHYQRMVFHTNDDITKGEPNRLYNRTLSLRREIQQVFINSYGISADVIDKWDKEAENKQKTKN